MTFPGERQPLVDEPPFGERLTSAPAASSEDDKGSSATDVAKSEAANVAEGTKESAQQVAQTSVEQAKQVTEEARQRASDLVGEARQQVSKQMSTQQTRAAGSLRSLADELSQMANDRSGVASTAAEQASDKARKIATYLEDREPGDLLDELRGFARQRPGLFLAGAAAAGMVLGRVTRGVVDKHRDDSAQSGSEPEGSAVPVSGAETAYGAPR